MIDLYITIKPYRDILKVKEIKLVNLSKSILIVFITNDSIHWYDCWEFNDISQYIIND